MAVPPTHPPPTRFSTGRTAMSADPQDARVRRGLCSCAGSGRWVRGCTWSLSACCPAGGLVACLPAAQRELSPPVHPWDEAPRGVVALLTGLGLAPLPLASLLLSPGVSLHPHLQGFPVSSISFSDLTSGLCVPFPVALPYLAAGGRGNGINLRGWAPEEGGLRKWGEDRRLRDIASRCWGRGAITKPAVTPSAKTQSTSHP